MEKKQKKKNTRRRTVCRTSTVCPKVEWRAASVIRRVEGARKEEELKDPGNISAVIISATVRQLRPNPADWAVSSGLALGGADQGFSRSSRERESGRAGVTRSLRQRVIYQASSGAY